MGIFTVPHVQRMPAGLLYLVLGILLGGLGIAIAGAVAKQKNSIILGSILTVLTVVGWVLTVTVIGALVGLPILAAVGIYSLVYSIMAFVRSGSAPTSAATGTVG